MTLEIIDASVAVKWFVAHERGREASLVVLERVRVNPRVFAVPELFLNEMLHVLTRQFDDVSRILSYMDALQNMGWRRLENGRECLHTAVELAKAHHLSGYDAIYAANAKLTDGIWLTADERAHKKIAMLSISRVVG